MGGSQRLTRAIGKAKAMDLILTGRTIDAAEADRSGLVSRVVPADTLLDEAKIVAATIAGMSLSASRMAKEAVTARSKIHACRRTALRAQALSLRVRHRRPNRGHERFHRKRPRTSAIVEVLVTDTAEATEEAPAPESPAKHPWWLRHYARSLARPLGCSSCGPR